MEITDLLIAQLRGLPKQIVNPRARNAVKERHTARNYDVQAGELRFGIYVRQSQLVPNGFSCGLLLVEGGGRVTTLTRYNGSDHRHKNHIEGTEFSRVFHIHLATERYAAAGKKPDHYAEPTDRFSTVEAAFHCLLLDWNIGGIDLSPQAGLNL